MTARYSARLRCRRCRSELVGPRTLGHGLDVDRYFVCGFCSTLDEENRKLRRLLRRDRDVEVEFDVPWR